MAAIAPIVLAFDVAFVSSMCDELSERINMLRLDWSNLETVERVHGLTFPLQFTLSNLNSSQGLGFTVGHKVRLYFSYVHRMPARHYSNALLLVVRYYCHD